MSLVVMSIFVMKTNDVRLWLLVK